MSRYQVKIDFNANLDMLANAISFEEASSSKFVKNELAWIAPSFTNLVSFDTLPPGTLLNKVKVVKHGSTAPAAHAKVWTGAMIVEGRAELVEVWRAN